MQKTFFFIAFAIFLATTGICAPFEFSIPVGAGDKEIGVASSPEGPQTGPTSLLSSKGVLFALDAFNQRITQFDASGTIIDHVSLPKGFFSDMARSQDGQIWLIEAKSRFVYKISGKEVHQVFYFHEGEGFPKQIDGLLSSGGLLVVPDFASKSLFRFTQGGKFVDQLKWEKPALSVVIDSEDKICFLEQNEDEEKYDLLVKIDPNGKKTELKVQGDSVFGARLLGFLPDGRGVALGISSWEPIKKELFLISPDGSTVNVDSFPYGFLFATRYGTIFEDSLWLNVSPLDGKKIQFKRYSFSK